MKKLLGIMLIVLLGLVAPAFGQTAKDAIEALQKLNARSETGISYKDYTPALGEANYKVKPYLESSDSNKNPKLKEEIRKTWVHYLAANEVLKYKFTRYSMSNTPDSFDRNSYIKTDGQMINELVKLYPEMSSKIRDGRFLDVSDAIVVIWKSASTELNFATKLLSLEENKKPIKPMSEESTKPTGSIEARLDQIEQLKSKGKITDKEYKQMRKEILSEATKSK